MVLPQRNAVNAHRRSVEKLCEFEIPYQQAKPSATLDTGDGRAGRGEDEAAELEGTPQPQELAAHAGVPSARQHVGAAANCTAETIDVRRELEKE